MARRRTWTFSEEKILIENYKVKTIKELEELLPGRKADSINSKIKRLKANGKIIEGKTEDTKQRSYEQRGKKPFFTVNSNND